MHHRLEKHTRRQGDHYEELHKLFHTTLLSACGSSILLRFCDQLYDLNIRYRYLAGKSLHYKKRSIAMEHKSILDAVVQREPELAAQRLIEHYSITGDFLAEQFS